LLTGLQVQLQKSTGIRNVRLSQDLVLAILQIWFGLMRKLKTDGNAMARTNLHFSNQAMFFTKLSVIFKTVFSTFRSASEEQFFKNSGR
jgi:hypothetical protein